jgi:hypothetical protein
VSGLVPETVPRCLALGLGLDLDGVGNVDRGVSIFRYWAMVRELAHKLGGAETSS